MVELAPIRRQRLFEEVAARLQRTIVEGGLREGDPLPSERELTSRFQVGRATIREALLALEQRGVVTVSNGERARVARPEAGRLIEALSGAAGLYLAQPQGMRDFQAVRHMVERAIVRDVARAATPEDLDRIAAALEQNGRARGDRVRFRETDLAFHAEIVRTLANPLLFGTHEALSGWLAAQRAVCLEEEDAEARAFGFHQRIFAALVACDPDAAEAAMSEHLDDVARTYWRRVDARPSPEDAP
ncbi:FCD domain-containing protein [Salinarimonas rosea]|uniref:FCD domain-containing protein n=1 Tax=Salinarimonas rosea TaxID=552063 RepID=UPI00040F8A43|nr:FCD domain-containing protein [Salinarimonas rosea]